MRVRTFAALILFLGSYLPLSFILLAQDYSYKSLHDGFCIKVFQRHSSCYLPFLNPGFSLGIFFACLACFVFSILVLKLTPASRELVVVEAKYIPAELMNYTLPYVVSFMSISYQETGKFVGLIIFLLWMFWITYRSGQVILNPILVSFGWRLYEVSYRFAGDTKEYSGRILSCGWIAPGQRHKFSTIQDVIIVTTSEATGNDANFR